MDERIGYGEQFPALTLGGKSYTRPVSTRAIGGGYFVALDAFPHPNLDTEAEIAALQATLPRTHEVSKKKGKHDDESESASGEQGQHDVTEAGETP